MALAVNLHTKLFEAIEAKFNSDSDLTGLVGTFYRDFMPSDAASYPCVVVRHGQEGGSVDQAVTLDGYEPAGELMLIAFEVYATTCAEASQIGWQIAQLFNGWNGSFGHVDVLSTAREQPVWAGQDEEGVCSANVLFTVSCAAT